MNKDYIVLGSGIIFLGAIAYLAFQEVEDHPNVVGLAVVAGIVFLAVNKKAIALPAVI